MRLKELVVGERFSGIVGVVSKVFNSGKDGSGYIKFVLGDCSGKIGANMWQVDREIYNSITEGQPLKVTAVAGEYKGVPQLKIESISPVKPSDNFVPEMLMEESQEYTLKELEKEFDTISKHWLTKEDRKVLEEVMKSKNTARLFKAAPAGMNVHHTAKHGLFAHTISVAKRCLEMAKLSSIKVDQSLLILGALLHDIGKAYELDWGAATIYTTSGRLLGHTYIGAHMVNNVCKQVVTCSAERTQLLVHLILAHHGKREYGAAQPPQTIEAQILHYCDNIDAKVERMRVQQEINGNCGWGERDFVMDGNALYFGGSNES